MDQLFRLKDSVVQFLSPPSKRRRTLPATPAQNEQEHHFRSPISDVQDKRGQLAALSRINQKHLSPSDTKNPRKRSREGNEEDGHTESEESGVSPDDSISQNSPGEDETSASESEPVEEDGEELIEEKEEAEGEEEEISPDAKVQEYLARQAELALRIQDIEKVRATGGFHPDEILLYERLSMRSFEEILPLDWQIDFPTLPKDIFTTDPKRQFINFNCSPGHHGVKALQALIIVGGRVRDNVMAGISPERPLAREIAKYIKWSEKDGGFRRLRYLPVLTVVAAKHGQAIDSISTCITNQLVFLAEQHRDLLRNPLTGEEGEVETYRRQPPLLYGIIVAQSMAIFVTLDSANPDAHIRHLKHVNFKERGLDVWNGIAIAMVVVVARNYIMSIKDELEEDDPESDEDA